MAGGHERAVRMHDQRYSHRLKAAARQFRTVSGGRSRHGIAMNVREIDPCLFKDAAITQHPATTAAAAFALPVVFDKLTAVDGGQFLANLILQLQQKRFNVFSIRFH
jgi:hypothetical protein